MRSHPNCVGVTSQNLIIKILNIIYVKTLLFISANNNYKKYK